MNLTSIFAALAMALALAGCSGVRESVSRGAESVSKGAGSLYESVRSTFSRSPSPAPPAPAGAAAAPAPSAAAPAAPVAAPAPPTAVPSTPAPSAAAAPSTPAPRAAPSAAVAAPAPSTAAANDYFSTRVCGVQIDGTARTARLRIEIVASSRLPANALIEIQFENPVDTQAPFFVPTVHKGGARALVFLSPPVRGVRARNYEVVVRIYDSSERKALLATATPPCPSLVDDREL